MTTATAASRAAAAPSGHGAPLLEVQGLKTWFPVVGGVLRKTTGYVKAVNDVTFSMHAGEVLSVVGESGCGKSTLGYSILGLTPPTEGRLTLAGKPIDIGKPSSIRGIPCSKCWRSRCGPTESAPPGTSPKRWRSC
jgi:ABC-type oligopeptide transport system ATPase subunit